ncbi:peptidoglycan-binding protein [Nocardioides sp. TF02-7]|uniref:peptidoglycan-binding domain-containing protein n=1 Tax=Nocardioides sp. TF02-7 TaxID=2917724 RepID=UPI001F066C1A|nr:peptidoglycan-binding protein [Nocardioides sp. TF02-7]UMG91002.1 peptidoglycan-binding protein [Nocardioides sp. TF02-7]
MPVDFTNYPPLRPGRNPSARAVTALQCLLSERGHYRGKLHGRYDDATITAVRAWKTRRGLPTTARFTRAHWVAFHAEGWALAAKLGSTGAHVRRAQRALNAADPELKRRVDGVFSATTAADVRAYQKRTGLRQTGIVNKPTWAKLRAGVR